MCINNKQVIIKSKSLYQPEETYSLFVSSSLKSAQGRSISKGIKLDFIIKDTGNDLKEQDSADSPRILHDKKGSEIFTLHHKFDEDYFQIDLKAGEAFIFDVINNLETVNTWWYYYNKETSSWDSITVKVAPDQTANMGEVAYMAIKDGLYQLRVRPSSNPYWSSLRPLTLNYEILNRDDLEVDSLDKPRYLDQDTGLFDFSLRGVNDSDFYGFELSTDEALSFKVNNLGIRDNTRYRIYYKDTYSNRWVIVKSDWLTSRDKINFKASESGEYRLELTISQVGYDKWNYRANLSMDYSILRTEK